MEAPSNPPAWRPLCSTAALSAAVRMLRRVGGAWLALVLWFTLCAGAAPAQARELLLDDRPTINVWPSVTLLADTDHSYTAEQLVFLPQRFVTPTGTASNLGRRAETLWLRVPLRVPEHAPGAPPLPRVLEIDYPTLNLVELSVWRGNQLVGRHRMGNQLPLAERAMATRTHAAPLDLAPGSYVLLLRVHTLSSVVLPITVRTAEAFTRYESQVQLTQGLLLGLTLCMMLYSLAHWLSLRDAVFLDYALLLAGNAVFSLTYFGIGPMWLWPQWPAVSALAAPMGIMVAVVAGTRFTRATLAVREVSVVIDTLLRVACGAALVGLVGCLLGLIGYRAAQSMVTVLGIAVTLVVLPTAAVRLRRGDRIAGYTLVGWTIYTAGALTMAGILRGLVEPTFWTQHVYPISTLVEMAAWMAVLGQRVKSIHSNADRARVESETLRTMAHTDALTGLPNRRGLNEHLGLALRKASPERILAVYLMDLDGFKPVNDRYGHDVGDALLVAVGRRLQDVLRGQDLVARLGGDEFVVLAGSLRDEQAAQALGHKLLASFSEPFLIAQHRCEVGLTIGYALAPMDGTSADALLKQADAAMYAGKQQGRRRVQRAHSVLLAGVGVGA